MAKDLTNSDLDRKNILNNNIAIQEVYQQVGFLGLNMMVNFDLPNNNLRNILKLTYEQLKGLLKTIEMK
jgi:hypothetical protein